MIDIRSSFGNDRAGTEVRSIESPSGISVT
jgi:hypothetical protein